MFDPAQIIAQERMDAASVGPASCLTVTDDGRLADDGASEPADLSSEEAFRAQVQRWRAEVAPSAGVAQRVSDEIKNARDEIADTTDGPITAFVLISRACLGASQHPERPSAYANALYEDLTSRGWCDAEAMEVTGS